MSNHDIDDTKAVLETLNDPLLTILGVLLMASLWLILPGKSDSAVSDAGPYRQLTHTVDSLRQQMDAEALEASTLQRRLDDAERDLTEARDRQAQEDTGKRKQEDVKTDLSRRLVREREQAVILQADLANSAQVDPGVEPGHPLNEVTSKASNIFYVHGDYVAPVDKDHFARRTELSFIGLGFGNTTIYTRVKPGIHVSQLKNASGAFARCLDSLSPETDCVIFCVRDSGFDTFRVAREVVREAGLDVGWEPIEPEPEGDVVRTSARGRDPHVN